MVVDYVHVMANLNRPFYIPGNTHYFLEDWNSKLLAGRFSKYIEYALSQAYMSADMADTGILKDGKGFVFDTICVNPAVVSSFVLHSQNQEQRCWPY
jgi:hypothetical protein